MERTMKRFESELYNNLEMIEYSFTKGELKNKIEYAFWDNEEVEDSFEVDLGILFEKEVYYFINFIEVIEWLENNEKITNKVNELLSQTELKERTWEFYTDRNKFYIAVNEVEE